MHAFKTKLADLGVILHSPLDQVILIFCILLSYPLGFINYFITDPKVRLIYGLTTGLLMQYFMYGTEIFHTWGAILASYIYIRIFGRTRFSSPTLHLFLLIAQLSHYHFKQMLKEDGGWCLDLTLIYMQVVCKLSSVAWCYEDGLKPDEEFKNEYQKKKKIIEMPSLLEFFSYNCYYSQAVVGPYMEFSDFRDFINLEKDYREIPMGTAFYHSIWEMAYGFTCMYIFLKYKTIYSIQNVISDEFAQYKFFYKLYYLNIAMTVQTCKFYIAWKLITGTNIFVGLSYQPEEKTTMDGESIVEDHFNKIQAVKITNCIFYLNVKDKIEGWNYMIHVWLKYQVMLRFINSEWEIVRDNRVLLTYMVSAIWHGWYFVYYWVFFDFYIIDRLFETLKKDKVFERLEHSSYIIHILTGIINLHLCNYLGTAFGLLTKEKTFTFYKNLYFITNICVYLAFIYVQFFRGKTHTTRIEPGKPLDLNKISSKSLHEVKETKKDR